MINNSRIDIYDYIYDLVCGDPTDGKVTPNVYRMGEPTDNSQSDTNDGFLVLRVGQINDESEFTESAYMWARCWIYAYIPKKSRGRLNKDLYKTFETAINDIIKQETANGSNKQYYIVPDSVISMDDDEAAQKGNQYHLFVKSFVVGIDEVES